MVTPEETADILSRCPMCGAQAWRYARNADGVVTSFMSDDGPKTEGER